MKITFLILIWLLFSFSGWLAVVKFFTLPHHGGDYCGQDLSWCDCVLMAIFSLMPIVNVSMNCFWIWYLRQLIKRRPLIKFPNCKFNVKLPKFPVAIHGKKSSNG